MGGKKVKVDKAEWEQINIRIITHKWWSCFEFNLCFKFVTVYLDKYAESQNWVVLYDP